MTAPPPPSGGAAEVRDAGAPSQAPSRDADAGVEPRDADAGSAAPPSAGPTSPVSPPSTPASTPGSSNASANAPAAQAGAGAPPSANTPRPPTPPTTPRDETTGRPLPLVDETGQPIVRRDETGQPLVRRDETGQVIPEETAPPTPDSLLRPDWGGAAGGLDAIGRPRGEAGAVDWMAQVALVEGYNSNVVQTQDLIGGPVTRHPSPFTGIDASASLRTWTSFDDAHELRLQVRGQHYTPLESYSEPDDGSVNAGWGGQFTLARRTVLTGRALATITTVNSARLSDGPLFQIDPSTQQRTYTLETARFALVHELKPRWRVTAGADVDVSTTVHDAPYELPTGKMESHTGLDYVQPAVDVAGVHDLGPRDTVSLKLRYQPTYTAFLVDFSRLPARSYGTATMHMGELDASLAHAFSERWRSISTVGAVYSTAPPLDEDRRPIFSPALSEEIVFVDRYWLLDANASYTYGSANPRLGFGPAASAGLALEGTPLPHGALRHLDVLVNAFTTRAAFRQGPGALSRLEQTQASAELRYALTTSLGILGGYSFRYATFEGVDAFPSLLRHVLFLGVSGYFATDRTLPTLQTFVSPITPPG